MQESSLCHTLNDNKNPKPVSCSSLSIFGCAWEPPTLPRKLHYVSNKPSHIILGHVCLIISLSMGTKFWVGFHLFLLDVHNTLKLDYMIISS